VNACQAASTAFASFERTWSHENPTPWYVYFTVLDDAEIRRRLKSAREFRGMTQVRLAELVAADGLDKHTLGKVERGKMTLLPAYRRAAALHLRVPEPWFTEPNVELMEVANYDDRVAAALERLTAQAEALIERIEAVEGTAGRLLLEIGRLASRLSPPEEPPADRREAG